MELLLLNAGRKLHIGLACGEPSAWFPSGRTLGLSLKEHMAKARGASCLQERRTCVLSERIPYSLVRGSQLWGEC